MCNEMKHDPNIPAPVLPPGSGTREPNPAPSPPRGQKYRTLTLRSQMRTTLARLIFHCSGRTALHVYPYAYAGHIQSSRAGCRIPQKQPNNLPRPTAASLRLPHCGVPPHRTAHTPGSISSDLSSARCVRRSRSRSARGRAASAVRSGRVFGVGCYWILRGVSREKV